MLTATQLTLATLTSVTQLVENVLPDPDLAMTATLARKISATEPTSLDTSAATFKRIAAFSVMLAHQATATLPTEHAIQFQ